MHRAGSFAGAAHCDILWSDGALKQMSSGLEARVKAAPLQVPGTQTFLLHSQIFEDEDDDEYEDDGDRALSKQIRQCRIQRGWTCDHAVPVPKTVVGEEIVDYSTGSLNYGQSTETIPGIDMRLDVSNQPPGGHVA
jgi:hypothetical protein